MSEEQLPEHIRQVIPDFMKKCQMIQNLGKGTFGYVSLYDTPKGRFAIKETKSEAFHIGFPKNFIYEADALYKFICLPNVCRLKGIMYDDKSRKGYLMLEQMDGDLSRLSEELSFSQRMSLLPGLIRDIGTTLAIINSLGFVHNDMKSNNILHLTTRQGTVFKITDFGNFTFVTNPNLKYKGITVYSSPYHENIYSQELWAFCICCTELLLGRKTFSSRERDNILAKYSTKEGFDINKYLRKLLGSKLVEMIPEIYWKLVKCGFSRESYSIIDALKEAQVEIPTHYREKILSVIPKASGVIHPKHQETVEIFSRKLDGLYSGKNRFNKLKSFQLLCSYFFRIYGERLTVEEGSQYSEVMYVSLFGNRVDKLENFKTNEEFIRLQKAFFVTMKHQVLLHESDEDA